MGAVVRVDAAWALRTVRFRWPSGMPGFGCTGSCGDFTAPSWTFQVKRLLRADVDAQVFEGRFEAVFVAFRLSSD